MYWRCWMCFIFFFFFQAEDGIRDRDVTGVQTCALPICLSRGLGFSKEDRDENIRRIGFVARLLSRSGAVAIAAAISPYRDVRDEIRREHDAPFVEIFVDCPIDALVKRDPKGLYAKALRGEIAHFSGISDPYEPPVSPDIIVHTDREAADASRDAILRWLEERGLI